MFVFVQFHVSVSHIHRSRDPFLISNTQSEAVSFHPAVHNILDCRHRSWEEELPQEGHKSDYCCNIHQSQVVRSSWVHWWFASCGYGVYGALQRICESQKEWLEVRWEVKSYANARMAKSPTKITIPVRTQRP